MNNIAPIPSPANSFNWLDFENVVRHMIIFLVPLAVVVIPVLIKDLPAGWGYGGITLYLLNALMDIFKQYQQNNQTHV